MPTTRRRTPLPPERSYVDLVSGAPPLCMLTRISGGCGEEGRWWQQAPPQLPTRWWHGLFGI